MSYEFFYLSLKARSLKLNKTRLIEEIGKSRFFIENKRMRVTYSLPDNKIK